MDRSDSNSSVGSNWSSADSNSLLNNAFELSKGLPKVDRESKKEALLKYFGVEESSLGNVESIQQAQINVVDKSLQRGEYFSLEVLCKTFVQMKVHQVTFSL